MNWPLSRSAVAAVAVLGVLVAGIPAGPASAPPSDPPRARLHQLIERVADADDFRYAEHDSQGQSMDTVKIISDPAGGYLAVYHSWSAEGPRVSVATSADLVTWTFRRELGRRASQPTLAPAGGGFVVAWEQEPGNHLAFRYYHSRADLLGGAATRTFEAARTLSTCAEGTPNLYRVTLAPDIDHSTIDVGGHYFANCSRDRQQRGTLTNFTAWRTSRQPLYDNALLHWGVQGNIGDRDAFSFDGFLFGVIEGQFTRGDFGSWRCFVYDHQTGNAEPLAIRTHGGSAACANPTTTVLIGPDGRTVLVVTLFLPSEAAAPGEAGQLIYYRAL